MNKIKCSICEKNNNVLRHKITNINDTFKLYLCKNCNHLFVHPIPKKDILENYYKNLFSLPPNQEIKVKNKIKYIMNSIDFDLNKKRILEIGYGGGFLINEFIKNNYYIEGIDICNKNKKLEQLGIKLYEGEITNKNFKPIKKYDIIIMLDVVEHIADLNSYFRKINLILKKNGYLIITTPNLNSLNYSLLGKFWNWLSPPGHLNYFSKKSINILFKNNNFDLTTFKTWKGDEDKSIVTMIFKLPFTICLYYLKFFLLIFFKKKIKLINNNSRKLDYKKVNYFNDNYGFFEKFLYNSKNGPEMFVVGKKLK